ncbi:hypothetical protein M405DRAFT_810062 [Rhizopogon salebrosus TDB-379]|nr:hypothetical protein M405DRAFT_810062 [Rhizopogon salebrosus TDB-379]
MQAHHSILGYLEVKPHAEASEFFSAGISSSNLHQGTYRLGEIYVRRSARNDSQ